MGLGLGLHLRPLMGHLHGEVTEQKALEFAHGYLHDNAARIYAAPMQ